MRDKTSYASCLPFLRLLSAVHMLRKTSIIYVTIKNTNWYLLDFTTFGFCCLHSVLFSEKNDKKIRQ